MLSRIVARLVIYLILITLGPVMSQAAVLPEERLDAMYHSYDGGGADNRYLALIRCGHP